MKKSYLVVILIAALITLLIGLPQALAYEKWPNGVNDQEQCAACHGAFREGTYFSAAEGVSWGCLHVDCIVGGFQAT